ncbi:hypothetical protein CEQ90_01530 [Lewinellaceae bacterium SD302]|nr:hypothetical protein CEQ90_01530 [Lewinellaceae bacterium SD302]
MFFTNQLTRWVCILCVLLVPITLSAQNIQDYNVTINGIRYDPEKGPPDVDPKLLLTGTAANNAPVRLIQFRRPLNRKDFQLLREEYGLSLDRYFPNLTYLEKMDAKQAASLADLSQVRWIGAYHPAFKLSSTIGQAKFETPARRNQSGLVLLLQLHPEENLERTAEAAKATGAEIMQLFPLDTRGVGDRIRVRIPDRSRLNALAALPQLEWIEEEGDITLDNGGVSGVIQSGGAGTPVHDRGIRGENQIVGVIDAMLDTNHCYFADTGGNLVGPSHRKVVALRSDNPGTFSSAAGCIPGHGTHTSGTIAGFSAGDGNNGIAFNARLSFGHLSDIIFSDGEGTKTFLQYLNAARADGAFIHSNSWSDKASDVINAYSTLSQDLDVFTWNNEEQLVVVSSGNNNSTTGAPSPIRPPFSSINGISVAASAEGNTNNVSTGASGPTWDSRIKPDIYAPGSNTTSAQAGTNCGTNACAGSSMATPAVAASAALIRQYYTEGWYPTGTQRPDQAFIPTGALLKATLLNSTRDMTGNDASGSSAPLNGYPTNLEGWGNLILDDALYFSGDARDLMVWGVRHADGLLTGESDFHNVVIAGNAEPLKITLVWNGPPPAAANFATPVINDLNLTVTAPDGTTYNGNDFSAGVSVANSVTVDTVNNVEMILVNNPQPGNWQVEVNGQQVNQGNPAQGYALVVTADGPNLPDPSGNQNTIVALTSLPGTNPAGPPSAVLAQELIDDVAAYIDTISYEGTTIDPVYLNVSLSSPLGNYLSTETNPLIEMAEDVIAELLAADPDVFDRGTADPADDIDRMIILLNDQNFTGDWATTGGWPYELPNGLNRRISVSVTSVFNDPARRTSHALGHQFGLEDLYNHPGVVFAQPHVDNWGLMANTSRHQPLAWSKEKADWLTDHDANSVRWIPRPAPGSPTNVTIPLNWQISDATDNPRAIAIGLTPGVTDLEDENVFYFLEARSNELGRYDGTLPETEGVLLYYVNENIRQGEGPVRLIDQDLTTPNSLDDAAFGTGTIPAPGGTGLGMEVLPASGSEAYRIRINYDPPATTNDVNIRVGDPFWTSPDIWVDAQPDGFDEDEGRSPADRENDPIAGEDNRIYFRVTNPGPGTAFDVTVAVRISEPYHTVGGEADFNRFVAQKYYPSIAAGATITDYVVWRPGDEADVHACIQVKIQEVFNDVNDFNNTAQQNTTTRESTTASPYEPVTFDFSVTNPDDYHQLVYFRLEGLPQGWTYDMAERKKRLDAQELYFGQVTVYPPDDAEVCTEHELFVTSWLPKGNTLVPLGGTTLNINLRNRTTLTANTRLGRCGKDRIDAVAYQQAGSVAAVDRPRCAEMVTAGCTEPARPNEEIILRYEAPNGDPVYRTVMTDENGCYSDTYVVTDGGEWRVSATYPGGDCSGGTTTGRRPVAVPIPAGNTPGGVGSGLNGKQLWYSFHLGSAHPLGDFDDLFDANVYAALDITYPFNDRFDVSLIAGLAQFTAEVPSGLEHERYLHLSANLNWRFSAAGSGALKPYLRAGTGYYRNKAGNNSQGINFGLGGVARIGERLLLSPGVDLHYAGLGKEDARRSFLTAHLGILFR